MDKIKKALKELIENEYVPTNLKWFTSHLPYKNQEVIDAVNDLVAEGALVKDKKDQKQRYYRPEQLGFIKGKIQQSGKGYAFLLREDDDDLFIPPGNNGGAWHGDEVLVMLKKRSGYVNHRLSADKARRQEGQVVRVLQRANTRIVGTYDNSFVYPDDKKLVEPVFVGKVSAKVGDKAVVNIISWAKDGRKAPKGQIVEIFGHRGDKNLETLSVLKKYELPMEFTEETLREAEKNAVIREKDKEGRVDFRDEVLVTIDGSDARDLDDAVSLKKLSNGNWQLGVHIADVAHYVRANSPLDQEASLRATSVYMPDLVIPMLPQALSNNICSLNAHEDRLAMSCLMEINSAGEVVASQVCESVINVSKRLSYEEVNAALVRDDKVAQEELADYLELLQSMSELRTILRTRRFANGAIDFDFPETKIIMENGEIKDIACREQGLAEQIIEEMMICANKTVAETYFNLEAPFLYRVHEAFSVEDLPQINEFLASFGYAINNVGRKLHPQAVQAVLREAQGTPEERIVSLVLLRSMNHACYTTAALGHFALSMPYYSHFTSPIRRYPDLLIHRVIKAYFAKGNLKESTRDAWRSQMEMQAVDCSEKERRAEEIERQVVKAKCCQFMKQKIGQIFDGHISGVTGYGLFVELENSVEGLVRVSNMNDDYYEYNAKKFMLTGQKNGNIYRLGDAVRIQVFSVDDENMFIDFLLADDDD